MNPVIAARIHLLLSHAPVAAILLGLGLLVLGVWASSRDIQKAALGVFVLGAVLAVASYLTGEPAAGAIKGLPGFSERILEQHQSAAGVALAGCIVLGIVALAGLILFRGRAIRGWFGMLLMAAALLAGGLTVRTAGLGGQIRHSEIRPYDAQAE